MLLDKVIRNVVSTIRLFEKGFTSVQRNPVDLSVRIGSVGEFVECRLNFELFKVDEFRNYEEMMDGYLMKVRKVEGERSRGYSRIHVSIGDKPGQMNDELYNEIVNKVASLIGGKCISFSDDKRNLNIVIE